MSELHGHAICKDCGNGTLNNSINEQFTLDGDVARCMNCSSSHIDGELYTEAA